MNKFTSLFKRYNWTVQQLGTNSFIAYNEIYFVPFSCIPCGNIENEYISAVSYLLCDKDSFIEAWKNYNRYISLHGVDIGTYAFNDYFCGNSKFYHVGALANHDHCAYEVEKWLEHIDRNKKKEKESNNEVH